MLIKGILMITYLSAPPESLSMEFKSLAECKAAGVQAVAEYSKNPAINGIGFICEPAGKDV